MRSLTGMNSADPFQLGLKRFSWQGCLLFANFILLAFVELSLPSELKAIPESDAIKKLKVIPVFVITDSKGVPLPIPRGQELVLPLYLESSKADEQLKALRQSNPNINARIIALPLDEMNKQVEVLNGQLNDRSKRLVAPIVGNEADRIQAVKILKEQGLSEQQIREGLNVPVFFTKPFLTLNTPEGPRGVFFFSYANLQNALAKLPLAERQKLKPQVADLTAVLREIISAPTDSFTIYPTEEYFRLADNKNTGRSGTDYELNTPQDLSTTVTDSQSKPVTIPDAPKSQGRADVASIAQSITVRIEGPGPSGSGTIISRNGDNYLIATAWHVLSDVASGESVRVIFPNGSSSNVLSSGFNRIQNTDLAILNVRFSSDTGFYSSVAAGSIRPGDWIAVTGWSLATRDNPVLYRHLTGSVVSVNPTLTSDGYTILYTTSSPTLEGMSGGPVINELGLLIGIHGKAERLPSSNVEGVKDVATTNGQAMSITLINNTSIPQL